ncbi:MAG: hypothetical protein HRU40_19820 [Saprospiraceae bacterium]|nr:hypothetical protein [Saprospiraceae bacterium]
MSIKEELIFNDIKWDTFNKLAIIHQDVVIPTDLLNFEDGIKIGHSTCTGAKKKLEYNYSSFGVQIDYVSG